MIESIGSKLRTAREAQSLSLEQASRATYIRTRYLEALEAGKFGVMPSHAQVRGFLRSYADYLGLNSTELLASLRQDQPPAPASLEPEDDDSPQESPPQLEANLIFQEIGQALQQRRDMLSLTLDEVTQHTHIPNHYLLFLENGEFNRFPSPTQARGMLGNYSKFLNMDSESVLLRYADGLQAQFAARQSEQVQPEKRPTKTAKPRLPLWLRNFLSADVILAVALVIVMVFIIFWSINRISSTTASIEEQPTAPSIAEALLPTRTPEPTTSPTSAIIVDLPGDSVNPGVISPETESPIEIIIPVANPSAVQILLVVRQRTWLRVTVDGEIEFEGRAAAGENLTFTANDRIEVFTSNAAALQVYLGERDLGTMGIFGEIVKLIYTTEGINTPEPSATPTADLTEAAQTTPTPEPTEPFVIP